jgi:hypothetical protein
LQQHDVIVRIGVAPVLGVDVVHHLKVNRAEQNARLPAR